MAESLKKICTGCGGDVSKMRRFKNAVGNYYCEACYIQYKEETENQITTHKVREVPIEPITPEVAAEVEAELDELLTLGEEAKAMTESETKSMKIERSNPPAMRTENGCAANLK